MATPKRRKSRGVVAEIVFGNMKPTPGNEVVKLCPTCPTGKWLIKTVTRRVKKELGLK